MNGVSVNLNDATRNHFSPQQDMYRKMQSATNETGVGLIQKIGDSNRNGSTSMATSAVKEIESPDQRRRGL